MSARRVLAIAVFGLALPLGAARAQESEPVWATDGASIHLEVLAQPQVSTSSVDSVLESDFELRRARVTAEGEVGDRWSARFQLDFETDRARFRDAFLEARVNDGLSIRAGQFKVPFNGIELESAKRLIAIERTARVRGTPLANSSTSGMLAATAMSARNRGLMALTSFAGNRIRLQGGVWLGAGERSEGNDGKQLSARFEFEPWAGDRERIPLIFAAAVTSNGYFGSPRDTLVVVSGDTLVTGDGGYATAFEGWVELGKYAAPGIHVAGNVIAGDNPLEPQIQGEHVEFSSFFGTQLWGEYVFGGPGLLTGIGIGGRMDRFDPDTDEDDDAYLLWTPLVNLYFGRVFKLQTNVDVLAPEGEEGESETALRVQAQLVL